jgi:SAM-dependent MidA family methyltransferase
MGSSSQPAAASPAFIAVFRAHAGPDGVLPFARFMELALYHPDVGYYRQARRRVGYGPGTDFYTASTSGAIFGELIVASCRSLLPDADLSSLTFVEIGAEPSAGILREVAHPFGAARTIRVGEPISLTGRCVVFSNELFDAQPFRRFVRRASAWHELGVQLRGDHLIETTLPVAALPAELPATAPDGYVIDAPLAAAELLRSITAQPWAGLFITCDYGKSWRELTTATPNGTARTYAQHEQGNDLLGRPGEQDLTCHVCWDWLTAALAAGGFQSPQLESQEAFLVKSAGAFIAAASTADAARFSQRKLALMQLLHPAHLGQKFQVLHAVRN